MRPPEPSDKAYVARVRAELEAADRGAHELLEPPRAAAARPVTPKRAPVTPTWLRRRRDRLGIAQD